MVERGGEGWDGREGRGRKGWDNIEEVHKCYIMYISVEITPFSPCRRREHLQVSGSAQHIRA